MTILNGKVDVMQLFCLRNVYFTAIESVWFDWDDLLNASFPMFAAESDISYDFEMISWMLQDHRMISSSWRW